MEAMIVYLLKINVAIVLFYGFYRLFFQQDTLFQWKRPALLAILLISFLYPFTDITRQLIAGWSLQTALENGIIPTYTLPEVIIDGKTSGRDASWLYYLPYLLRTVYMLAAGGLLIRLFVQTSIILHIIGRAQTMELYGQTVRRSPGLKTPFSFFGWIVLDPAQYTETELQEILRHEETHVRQCHSIDTLLSELLCVFCWFNPFAWLLKREIRINLEFLADRSVLASGYEAEHYQFHLLRLSYHKAAAKLSNNFNVSPLKKRIFMMNKKQTSKISAGKYALLLPLIAFLLFFNCTVKSTTHENEVAASPQDTVAVQADREIYSHVEVMPSFPGGETALMQWLAENIHYPEDAAANGIQGRIIVRFVVNEDGSISDAEIVKSLDPVTDAEALRVVNSMPAWSPGQQNGVKVPVYYTLPILFKLPN